MDKIIRVNMRSKQIYTEQLPLEYKTTGGRGLIAKIMLNEVNPVCDPLGRENKLIYANGLLTGTIASSVNRISIGAKSPLTGGIKESNGGGITAMWLALLNIKALVIEDVPEDDNWYYIKIDSNGCSLEDANEYKGMYTSEFVSEMLKKYKEPAISCIGLAGERLYKTAGIANLDKDKNASRYSGRGGLGAVMGSKKLKGVVISEKGSLELLQKERFSKAMKDYNSFIIDAPSTLNYRKLGTASVVRVANDLTGLPTRNFRGEKFEHAEKISGESLFELIESRGGEGRTSHACMPGCIIQCSNIVPDKDGKTIVSPLEYETIGLMGSNLGIGDLDIIAKMNVICNDLGIDTIETGAAIGVAMEAKKAEFGDGEAAINLLNEIEKGTSLGEIIAQGAKATGEALGVENVPVVNSQAMAAYDPRAIKGMGITYSTSAMGADHTYGPVVKTDKTHTEAVIDSQLLISILDSLGICIFTRAAIGNHKELLVELANSRNNLELDLEWLHNMAKETIRDELKFNELAGFTKDNYKMPDAFTKRRMKELDIVFDVDEAELERIRNIYA